jgi:hypothetical protein
MGREYNASIDNFVSTVVVDNWRGTRKTVRMDAPYYDPERGGVIVTGRPCGPTQRASR